MPAANRQKIKKSRPGLFKRSDRILHYMKRGWWIIVIILAIFMSNTNAGRRLLLPDACPGIEPRPGTTIKLLNMTLHGEEKLCCGCETGTYLAKLCFNSSKPDTRVCKPCGNGTYMSEKTHRHTSCLVDNFICPPGKIKIPAEADKSPRCDCPPHYYRAETDHCLPHTKCRPGYGVMTLPNPIRDTVCEKCTSGYESLLSSSTEGCSLSGNVLKLKENENVNASDLQPIPINPSENSTHLSNSMSSSSNILSIMYVLGLVTISIVFCIGLIYMLITRRRNISKSTDPLISGTPGSNSTSNLETSRDDSSFESSNDSFTNRQIMIQLRNDLTEEMTIDEAEMMMRMLEGKARINASREIANFNRLNLSPSQHICKIFDLLNKKMGEEFNPETLYDCFHNKMNQRILADIVHTYLQDIPTNQH